MRRTVGAGLLTLALALVAAGCGGAAAEDAAAVDPAAGMTPAPTTDATGTPVVNADGTTTPAPATTGATGATGSGDAEPGTNELSGTEAAGGAAIKISQLTPKDFARAHCSRPIVVVLHQPDSILDQSVLASANSALSHSSASIQKDTLLLTYTPREVKRYGDLLSKVGLLQSPGVAVVNRGGAIQNFYTGYVDASLLRKVIQLAAATKPCKVANEDAGAAAADPSKGAAAKAPVSNLANAATLATGGTVAPAPTGDASVESDAEKDNAALKLLN